MWELEESPLAKLRNRTYVSKEFEIVRDLCLPRVNYRNTAGIPLKYKSATNLPNIYKNTITSLFKSQTFEFKLEHLVTKWELSGHRQDNCLQGDSYLGFELHFMGMSIEGDDASSNTKHIVPFDLTFTVELRSRELGFRTFETKRSSGPHHVAFNTLVGKEVTPGFIKMLKPTDLVTFFKYCDVDPELVRGDMSIRVGLTLGVEVPKPQIHDNALDKLVIDMTELLISGDKSDFTIICGAESFDVHEVILSGRSPVFEAMLNSRLTETETSSVEIVDFELSVITYMLKYIYTSKFDPTEMNFEELLGLAKASHKYQLTQLHRLCLDALMCNLNEKNCGRLAVLGYLQDADHQFKLTVFSFCGAHWTSLAGDEDFGKLVKTYPGAFLKPKSQQ